MARLASGVWVQAYLMRLQIEGIAAYVVARGDPNAGAIWVKSTAMDGQAALWERQYDLSTDCHAWVASQNGPEADIDQRIQRERGRDRDLWVIEVEDRDGRHLLDDPSLA